jgi:hypothetical protein
VLLSLYFRKKVLFERIAELERFRQKEKKIFFFFHFALLPSLSGADDGRCGPMFSPAERRETHPLFFPPFFRFFGLSRTLLHITV